MKKISILVAAFAMIAFTGCNKEKENQGITPDENGMVTLNLAGESYGSNDKQGYYAADQYIEFQIGDQCYGNAALADLTLVDMTTMENIPTTDPTATSRFARLSIPSDNLTFPFTILYPANIFVEGAVEDFPEWNVPMAASVRWIPENRTVGYRSTVVPGQTCVWPMAAQVTDFRGTYQLKHTVAILTPQIKYGTAYLLALSRNNANFNYAVGDQMDLTVDSIVMTSSNSMLTGNAHVDFTNPAEPTLVMDGTVPADGDVLIVKPNSANIFDTYPVDDANTDPTYNLGNITCAPKHTGDQLQMTFYFTLTDGNNNRYHFVYTGNDVTLTETPEAMSVLRGFRTTLSMNLYNANGANKTTLLSVN